ncbi:MAG: hypothetical protein J6Y44_00105, partial [Clostridia bacterium]|nr:hypothetical protein [Clostridia bacterium]
KMETYESGDPMLSRMLIIDGYDVDDPEVTTYHNYISHAYDPTPTPLYEAIALIKNYNESIT